MDPIASFFVSNLVFRETGGDGIGRLVECSGAASLVNNCFALLR